jgi:hypothetical protein
MAQNKTVVRDLAIGIGFVTIALTIVIVLNYLYPLSREIARNRFPKSDLIIGYTISVLVLSILVVTSALGCSKRLHNKPGLASFIAAIGVAAVLVIYCIAIIKTFPSNLGLGILDLMNAKFLAEWRFIYFIGIITPLCAMLSAGLTWVFCKVT